MDERYQSLPSVDEVLSRLDPLRARFPHRVIAGEIRRVLDEARALATQRYKGLHELTIAQLNAIDLLVGGKTDKEVAGALGVHRVTVTPWRLYHPG